MLLEKLAQPNSRSNMNILFIGDIVGRSGRNAVKEILPKLKIDKSIDFVIANGENLASGLGMTFSKYKEMRDVGIDYFTSGNHIWDKEEFVPYLDDKKITVLRPANYADNMPGRGVDEVKIGKNIIQIISLQGTAFMPEALENPFHVIDKILANNKSTNKPITIIDFHAETTSEKNSLAYYLDGKITALFGTHTHVQTSDARILPCGTAYITDTGMCGSLNSSIGDELKYAFDHFLTGAPFKIRVEKQKPHIFNAVLIDVDEKSGKPNSIETIQEIIE